MEGLVIGSAWRGRRVLVTGHTGFKGAWLSLWLREMGAVAEGLALPPDTRPNLASQLDPGADAGPGIVDLLDAGGVARRVRDAEPEVVFHLAAQGLVPRAHEDPTTTYTTNVLGTVHLLEAIRKCPSVRAVVVVTSDKVYEPSAGGVPHTESDQLGGHEPYATSKAACELVVRAYRSSFFAIDGPAIATARAGNVIGGGDWAQDRVVPDVVRAWTTDEAVALRHPDAVRPWQHVLDPLHGYLMLAEKLLDDPESSPAALNFGPDPGGDCRVGDLVDRLVSILGAKPARRGTEASAAVETNVLRLSSARATEVLGWRPVLDLDDAIDWTATWYRAHRDGEDMRKISIAQIEEYVTRIERGT
ncbi:MAG: CDP-glucose 4,6-dehydratase [Acidimicrobiia bacterium]